MITIWLKLKQLPEIFFRNQCFSFTLVKLLGTFCSKGTGLFLQGYTCCVNLSSISTSNFHFILNYCATLMTMQSILIADEANIPKIDMFCEVMLAQHQPTVQVSSLPRTPRDYM